MAEGNIPNTRSEFSSSQKPVRQRDNLKCGRTAQNSSKNFCKMCMEEKSTAAQDELDDLTTCCICDDTYIDPMILPCVHTFCLTCLQLIGAHTGKNSGDQMPCPLCRQEFTIPEDGLAALKKNFFVVKLIEIATAKQKASITKQAASSLCDMHIDENICLYCFECNEVVCLVCVREWHQKHSLSDLNSAADILRSGLESDVATAKRCMSDALEKKESLRDKRSVVLEKIHLFEKEVDRIRRDLKALIDRHADSLLQNLESRQEQQLENIELKQNELDKHLDCLKNFEICCTELVASKHQHDITFCKMASEVKKQIIELKQLNESIVECQLNSCEINFTETAPTALEIYETKNIIGVVKGKIDYTSKPERVTRIGANSNAVYEGSIISGMAVSYNEVFVVYEYNPVVRIYDINTHKCTTQMIVKGMFSEVDLRDCVSADGNVYIVNGFTCEIIGIDENRDIFQWSTGDDSGRLSVSAESLSESTIVATCYETGALREYSLLGTLIQEIDLCATIVHPQHAVKLSNGHFVVSYGSYKEASSFDEAFSSYNDAVKGVCVVDNVGAITKSYDNCLRGFDTQSLLEAPTCLAVDENGNILILDGCKYGCRVLLLNAELEFKRELLTEDNGLRRSVAMQLVEETSQLYIADNDWETCHVYDSEVFVFSVT